MKGQTMNLTSNILGPLALGLVIAGIVYATLAGRPLPLISGPRAALIAILIIGMAMCMPGIGHVAANNRWLSLPGILGTLLGIVILVVIAAPFAGWKLPLVQSETQAVIAVAMLIAVKFLIATASTLFRWS